MSDPGKKYEGQPTEAARLYYYDDVIDYSSGSSGTAGQIAGICALILQANTSLTPAEIEMILVETANNFASSGPFPWEPNFAISFVPPMSSFPDGGMLPAVWGDSLDFKFGTFTIYDDNGEPLFEIPWMSDAGLDISGGGLVQADAAVKAAL
jgi:hypothetical protein